MSAMYLLAGVLVLTALSLLVLWRVRDHWSDASLIKGLQKTQPSTPDKFDPAMVACLPEPAQRYFLYTIAPGTPLKTVVDLRMSGRFGMGDKTSPGYMRMIARQVMAMPEGFVWKMRARRGVLAISGSDSHRWTRFWVMGLLPVARLGGDADHALSAFGRYVAEAVFWAPASALPAPGISWTRVGPDCARLTVNHNGLQQSVDLYVNEHGQPTEVRFERWSNANPQKQHRLQPFGGYLSEFRWFEGFRLPTHVEAGNQFATDEYFPFFIADITDASFH